MASTSQVLTWIELELHGWQREGVRGTRPLLNEAHKILNIGRREQNLLYDEDTGDFPYFTTQSGVYTYTVPSGVWLVEAVVVDTDNYPWTAWDSGDWKWEEVEFSGVEYYRILNVVTRPWRQDNQNAKIIFRGINPGASSSMFRRVAYKTPKNITSDAVQHEMPGDTDMQFLKPATMLLCDAIDDHEKMAQARQYIADVLKPQYWAELDMGEQGISSYCKERPY